MIFRSLLICLALAISFTFSMAQDAPPQNWFLLDLSKDGYPGMSTQKAYQELLNGKKGRTVVVAILDSGVDDQHEDLRDIMWVNEDEIPGNNLDDDNNGYVDDVHGWNFIGGKDGRNVENENLEVTRLYVKYKQMFDGVDPAKIAKKDRGTYDKYLEYKKVIEEKREEYAPNVMLYGATKEAFESLARAIGKDPHDISLDDVKNFKSKDQLLSKVAAAAENFIEQGESFGEVYDQVEEAFKYYFEQVNYFYNPEYDSRSIVGDDPANVDQRFYGNNDVEGSDAMHGTHVAGTVGAIRGNGIGIDGVADNVRIMSVRTVPNGDERDKDVANAIRYAVDNGAQVINMSFGKGASPYKKAVDEAVKYAMKHDVLIVHGAGNDNKEVSLENNFPNDRFDKKGLFGPRYAKNWIEVGAISWQNDQNLVADFSNFSPTLVDVFAPGVEIYSTVPDSKYKNLQGTSMASPMVAGLGALLRSYFPDLTAEQVKEIIMASVTPYKGQVVNPETGDLVPMSSLCVTGGMVNTYEAVKRAMVTKGKKKVGKDNSTGGMTADQVKKKNEVVRP